MHTINKRSCQPCTACCEGWLDIKIPAVNAHLGQPCSHCENNGCNIYSDRPKEPCQTFHCAWRLEGSLLPHTMRPDLSGVIVMTDQFQWDGEEVITAVATGTRIPARTFHWLCSLAKLSSRQLVAIEFKKDTQGFNGEFNLRTVGSEEFKQAMLVHFSQKGFTSIGEMLNKNTL